MVQEKETIKSGKTIIARVAIMGAKRGCGWKYTRYKAKLGTESGYVYVNNLTNGMYPNKYNFELSKEYEEKWIAKGVTIVYGRPNQNTNAPKVIK